MQAKRSNYVSLVIALIAGWLIIGDQDGGCSLPVLSPSKPTAVTYVREAKAPVPAGVSAALAELNLKGIIATEFPDAVTDGDNQVPDQYKVTLPAARSVGIPALVVQAGDKVLKTVKAPTTKAQVMEAAGL